ncbi:MAG: hypothetical protein LBD64_07755 [Odoribacteraceae bacterium]|jgi:hypothetical protein|nr:hypothetical protein [Odoribacteraceae bacterium]
MEPLLELVYYYRSRDETRVEARAAVQALLQKSGPGTTGGKSIPEEHDVAPTGEVKLLDMIRESEVTARPFRVKTRRTSGNGKRGASRVPVAMPPRVLYFPPLPGTRPAREAGNTTR